ncbi:MAG: hypothetical protein F4X02_10495 [Chloroflexi bacterium]|nr:hypothetical protein [Chloroflexota bacterium]
MEFSARSPSPGAIGYNDVMFNARLLPPRRLLPLLLVLCLCPLSAQAHGYIVRAIPADRSALERPPTRLQYWFSEDLEPRFSEIHLRDQGGVVIASGGVDDANHALLTLRVPAGLADGAYVVELRPAFASDGHVIAESRVFFVGEAVGGVAGSEASDRAIPLEALWRAALNLANFLFFGASLLYSAVLLPAWGRGAGGLPERVTRRVKGCLIAAVVLAFAANMIGLLQQSMAFFNTDAAQVLQQNLWQVVLIGSRFGDIWTFRVVLLIFCAVLLFVAEYYRALMPQLAAGIWRGLPWLGAIFIGLSMVTSHAAGSPLLPWVAIGIDWLHALAVAFWLGGALTLTLLLPAALAPYDAEQRTMALRAVLRRFSRILLPLVALVILSGLYNALNYFVSPADIASAYGRTLGVKLLLATPVFILGAWQHFALRPQLAARLPLRADLGGERLLRLEVALMLLTLLAVAWLSATPIPQPEIPRADIAAPQAATSLGELNLSSAIIPGGPGVNTYDTVIKRADAPAADVEVYIQLVNPQRDFRSAWHKAEQVEDGLYVSAGDEIDRAGNWWTLLDVATPDGVIKRAAFAWQINAAAAVQQARQPQLIHIVVLLGIAGVVAAWSAGRARRLLAALQLTPASFLIASLAVVVTLGVMVGGAQLLGERQRDYELTLNPPPAVVNSVLPDAASLARGEALYRERCLVWQGESADFRALRNRLATARDEFLYAAVASGWRGLSACGAALSVVARWDVVNYFRTFERRA